MSAGGKVVDIFGGAVAERVADKVVLPTRTPNSLEEFSDMGALQVRRDRQTERIGTFVALGIGVGVFFLVREWRQTKHRKGSVS